MLLHLFALLVAASTAVLIFAGGMVTSTGSGLAVPDWPNTYGWFMWTFPIQHWVGGIFYEHTHRLIASTVGFLILVLAVWLWRAEPRRWVRTLGFIALAAVITQGMLGGLTVLFYLPDPISIAHASLAQIVFCLTITIARCDVARLEARISRAIWRPTIACCRRRRSSRPALVYLQILIGATMRHTDAGLAIPDFPFAFGQLVPPHWDAEDCHALRASRRRARREPDGAGHRRPRALSPPEPAAARSRRAAAAGARVACRSRSAR